MPVIELTKPKYLEERELDLSKFIILEGRIGSYPDLYIAKYPTHFDNDWERSYFALYQTDSSLFMTLIPPFIDLILDLRLERQMYDGLGNKIDPKEAKSVLSYILDKKDPSRAEYLDARFKEIKNISYIEHDHRIIDGQLKPQKSEPLEICLMEDCYVDLFSANRQGLPTRKSKDKYVKYLPPINGSVAWFVADSGWAYLCCGWDPGDSGSWLGVRAAKIKN